MKVKTFFLIILLTALALLLSGPATASVGATPWSAASTVAQQSISACSFHASVTKALRSSLEMFIAEGTEKYSSTVRYGLESQSEGEVSLNTIIFSEGFEGAFGDGINGWSIGDNNPSGTTAYWDDKDSNFGGEGAQEGSWKAHCAGFGYAGTTSDPKYRPSMDAYMRRTVNLSGYTSASLSFYYKMPSIETCCDYGEVKINGVQVRKYNSVVTNWTKETISLNSYVGQSITIEWNFHSDGSVEYEGWYIDNIVISGSSAVQSPRGTIIDITASPTNPQPGQRVNFTVYVRNDGGTGTVYIGGAIKGYPGSGQYCNTEWKSLYLNAGASGSVTLSWVVPSDASGSYGFRASSWASCWSGCEASPCHRDGCCSDRYHYLEKDNLFTVVRPPRGTIIDITASPTNPQPGQRVNFTVYVRNDGGTGTVYIGGAIKGYPGSGQYCNTEWKSLYLNAGASGSVTLSWVVPSDASGSYGFRASSWASCWSGCEASPCHRDGCCSDRYHYLEKDNLFTVVQPPQGIIINPVYPSAHTIPSTVMQGGTAYRHFRLLDSNGNPIPNATVTLSIGSSATTDASGYFTATIPTSALGGLGSYLVSIQSVTIGGQIYSTNNQPSFIVQVTERRYAHSWSYGAVRTASAGVSTGLIAYLGAETNGGLGLVLEESNPDRTDDDQVRMEENYSIEINAGVGLGIRENIRAGIVKANLDASVTTESMLRHFGALEAEFNQPYAENDRKAQGIFLTLSVLDSALGVPTQPLVVGMLRAAEARFSYLDYISAQSVGTAAKVTPLRADVGAEINLAARRRSSAYKERTIGFTLLDVGASRLVAAVLTDYGNEYSIGFDDELSLDLTLLTPNLPRIQNKVIGVIGNRAIRLHKEYFFDSTTDSLKRIELTLTGEGNPNAFTDVIKKDVSIRMTLEGANLTPSLINRVGQAQVISDLNALLSAVPQIPYSVEVEDGSCVSFVPEIGIPGTEISLKFELEVEKTRNLVRERGVFLNGKPYVTETYNADALVSRPGKSWWDLLTNALGGLWLLVRDAFSWIARQVTSGVGWVIGTVAKTASGIIWGGAQIIAPPGTQLYALGFNAQGAAIQQTESVTVTAIGWVPEAVSGASALSLRPALAAASGASFVVGGIYEFQPYTLTLSPAATLVITYTDEAAAGVDESRIGMFRWNPEGNNWQPMAAISDMAHNVFTATITQLGTFALGYDGTPPQIIILEPANGSTISNTLPLIKAMVVDAGVGIDPATVEMRLDGQVVAATYNTGTGELVYLPTALLEAGQHTVQVSAGDVLGHVSLVMATFTVRPEWHIYLPLVLRNW